MPRTAPPPASAAVRSARPPAPRPRCPTAPAPARNRRPCGRRRPRCPGRAGVEVHADEGRPVVGHQPEVGRGAGLGREGHDRLDQRACRVQRIGGPGTLVMATSQPFIIPAEMEVVAPCGSAASTGRRCRRPERGLGPGLQQQRGERTDALSRIPRADRQREPRGHPAVAAVVGRSAAAKVDRHVDPDRLRRCAVGLVIGAQAAGDSCHIRRSPCPRRLWRRP